VSKKRTTAVNELSVPINLLVATVILNGMISSTPIVDRTTVDKKRWARIALEWADALIAAAKEKP
jgi:hypothetical protein